MSLVRLVPWRSYPEVWILVVALVAGFWWALRRLGPYDVPKDKPVVTGWQVTSFLARAASLWAVSDWPLHDIAEVSLQVENRVEIVHEPTSLGGAGDVLSQIE